MRYSFLLLLLLTLGFTARASAQEKEPDLRVRIIYTLEDFALTPSGNYKVLGTKSADPVALADGVALKFTRNNDHVILSADGKTILDDTEIRLISGESTAKVKIPGVPFGIGWWWEGKEDREYEGALTISVNDEKRLDLVALLPMERYLRGVVPSEIGGDSPGEALRAQAVAARSDSWNALKKKNYAGKNFDLCSDVECQVYSGLTKQTPAATKAIDDTRGIVLTSDGKPMQSYYASNCGGCSEMATNSWPSREAAAPYNISQFDSDEPLPFDLKKETDMRRWIESEPDVYCNPKNRKDIPSWTTKNFRWKVETTADELTAFVAAKKDIGRVKAIKPIERGPSGRLIKLAFVGEKGELEMTPELAIREIWKPPLRSTAFIVDTEGPADAPTKFIISGAGWGHGVGMCQSGAVVRALNGQDFREILGHYYKGADLTKVYE